MFVIAQISDSHLSAAKPFFAANFAAACAAIAARGADLVVNTGDITLNGADDDSDFVEARRLHDLLPLPWRAIPGNHDIGEAQAVAARSPRHGQVVDAVRLARYRRHFGADRWVMDLPGWRLVGFNALLPGSGLPDEAEQDAALRSAFAGAGDRHVALFGHKPFCDAHLEETALGGRFIDPEPRRQVLRTFGGVAPALIVSGHVHQFRCRNVGATRHVWGPSTGFVIPDRIQPRYGTKEVGYVEHRLHADGRHDCAFVRPGEAATLEIGDFPQAYGPL